MEPKVRKSNLKASNKVRSYQQTYGSHYGCKGPENDHQYQQSNQNIGGTTQ